jgi:hypothetical protein
MEKIKNYNKQILVVVIVALIVVFYWFEIRPASIRSGCKDKVQSQKLYEISDLERESLGNDMDKINRAEREKSEWWYKDCINGEGLAD